MRKILVLAGALVVAAASVAVPAGPASAATTTTVTPSVTSIDFGTQAVTDGTNVFGTPYTITFTNVSGSAQQLGNVSFTGASPTAFVIPTAGDTCSGISLAASGTGSTCTVTVQPNTAQVGTTYTASLTLPVTTDSNNTATVPLSAIGDQDPPVWAQPGPGYVILHWGTVPVTNGSTVTQYAFSKGTTPNNLQVTNVGNVGQLNQVTDTNVTPGQEYFYSVEPIVNGNPVQTNPPVAAIPWDVGGAGTFVGVSPWRILDTRSGIGAARTKVSPGHPVRLKVEGAGSGANAIPATNVGAVVLNLTATNVSQATAITAWPDGQPQPLASVLNLGRGGTMANLITVKLGTNGYVDINSGSATLDLIADVNGYYLSQASNPPVTNSGQYFGFQPFRAEDTRVSGNGPLPSHFIDTIPLFNYGDFSPHVKAAIVHVTAFSASAGGFLSVYNGIGAAPTTSSAVNYSTGLIVSNLAVVPVAPCNLPGCQTGDLQIGVYNGGTRAVGLVVDVVGIMDDNTGVGGSTFTPITPTRLVDTRVPQGLAGPIGPDTQVPVDPGSLADFMTMAVDTNVTAVHPTKTTFFTIWPAGFVPELERPGTSDLNASGGAIIPQHVVAQVGPANQFFLYNNAGTANAVVDVDGTFELRPYPGSPGTIAPQSTRHGVPARTPRATVTGPARLALHAHPEYRP